ncbi:hypothetical protein Fmac_020821 [Flemingia macrophylla]|uniref:Uncharacterized protein n=1 Tax=Flemingia macrophylla TaxID=520843 RepID=A0ABD1LV35_9FABA
MNNANIIKKRPLCLTDRYCLHHGGKSRVINNANCNMDRLISNQPVGFQTPSSQKTFDLNEPGVLKKFGFPKSFPPALDLWVGNSYSSSLPHTILLHVLFDIQLLISPFPEPLEEKTDEEEIKEPYTLMLFEALREEYLHKMLVILLGGLFRFEVSSGRGKPSTLVDKDEALGKDYWNWSWDELVAYDLPATFKYVHDLTGQKLHYVVIREGTTTMFDYENRDENIKHYGQPTPPVYNMTRIPNDLPLFLSYGGANALSDVKDMQRLLEILKDHDADKLVYEPLISLFRLQ